MMDEKFNMIKVELENPKPKATKILKQLFKFKKNQFNTPEYFEFIGETFKLNPEFFMKKLYKPLRVKIGKIIGDEKRTEMEKHILGN